MEKNNGKIIAVVALIVAVVALSVGFAAFTDSLTIDGNATVKGGNNDLFAGSFGYASTNPACVYTGGSTTASESDPGSATGNTWSGISIELSNEHPSVTCTAYIDNSSSYDATITSLIASGNVGCTSSTATNAAAICATVAEDVQIGNSSNTLSIETTGNTLSDESLSLTVTHGTSNTPVTITVSYDTSAGVPDGDILVTLPTITHGYTTVANGS